MSEETKERHRPAAQPAHPPILVGTSGYSFPDWVGPFYPPGIERSKMLDYYVREFPAVEVNATYYRIPPPATIRAMERKTPPAFEFVVKTHHDMTHLRSLEPELYQAFARSLEPLLVSGKLKGLLAQFPYSFQRSPENEQFLAALKNLLVDRERLPDVPLFVEFRHRSWAEESVWTLLDTEGIGYVSVDEPDLPGLLPPVARVTGPARIGYVRLHGRNQENWWRNPERGRPDRGTGSKAAEGHPRNAAEPVTAAALGPLFAAVSPPPAPGPSGASSDRYDYLYSEAEIQEWVVKIHDMTAKVKKTFVFFNNCHVGQAATGAKLMRRLLEGEGLL